MLSALRHLKDWSLLFHAFLLSAPCAALGVPGALVLGWGALHGGADVFAVAGAIWLLLSAVVPAYVILVFALWAKAGPSGPRSGPTHLKTLVVLAAAQGVPAMVMVGAVLGGEPFFMLLAVPLGAPWLSLACHMLWKAKRSEAA